MLLLSGSLAAQPGNGQTQTEIVDNSKPAEETQIPPPEKRGEESAAHLARMREVLGQVLKHLEEAREKRDVIKLNCVNEKLTAVKGLLKVSEQADVTMQEAVARRDDEASSHEFRKIAIARGKIEQLLAESEACVGELSVYSGDTQVEVVEPASQEPPPASGGGGTVVIPPTVASPFAG
jgi:hypothetical protein